MTAFRFYLDESGRVVGGRCVNHDLSSETWSLAHLPVIPIPPEDIAWPDGERWEHEHYVGTPTPHSTRGTPDAA